MKITPNPALLQALHSQPTIPKTQNAPPAVQAARQVLAARKAAGPAVKAAAPNAPPPKPVSVPENTPEARARDLPRGSLLDIVI
ncbi:MAG: hypothetical protein J4G10_01395 [Alphaproteobacteria bacterium]|nr:hypothetical protein [Alphaproteobacteria bacterium]